MGDYKYTEIVCLSADNQPLGSTQPSFLLGQTGIGENDWDPKSDYF